VEKGGEGVPNLYICCSDDRRGGCGGKEMGGEKCGYFVDGRGGLLAATADLFSATLPVQELGLTRRRNAVK